ncbi:MAG: class IV adenylate cyclase [Chitinophagaceae bacterium]|nr:class IV adenylate cyclase [Chitinophagaceae bacterium]
MSWLNVEIKAKCKNAIFVRQYLLANKADFKGTDMQTDTYFNVPNGRLKLREGNIENNLIFYERTNQAGPKNSHFNLLKVDNPVDIKEVLTKANGIKAVVKKRREIYYIRNVKFHIDEVPDLGSFVEIEAGNKEAELSQEELLGQCEFYMKEFGVSNEDLIDVSYSDMLMEKLFENYCTHFFGEFHFHLFKMQVRLMQHK